MWAVAYGAPSARSDKRRNMRPGDRKFDVTSMHARRKRLALITVVFMTSNDTDRDRASVECTYIQVRWYIGLHDDLIRFYQHQSAATTGAVFFNFTFLFEFLT